MKADQEFQMNSSAAFAALRTFAEKFWTWRAEHMPISYDDIPRMERRPGWIPDWTSEAIDSRRRDLAAMDQEFKAIDCAAWPISQQVDYRLIRSALARVHWELDILRSHQRNPDFYVHQTLGPLFLSLLKPPPFDRERCREILTRLHSVPGILQQAKKNLAEEAIRPFAVVAIEKLSTIRECLATVGTELQPFFCNDTANELELAITDSIIALESFRDWLGANLSLMADRTSVGHDAYSFFLKHVALMPFTTSQLLAMSRQEWERSVAFESFEKTRNAKIQPPSIFASQSAQIEREAQLEAEIREFLESRNILTVPQWVKHYVNLALPSYLAPLLFMGVTDDLTSADRLNENGISYIKQPSPDLDYFSLSIARDPRPLIVHEGVPGHYLQLVLSWAHENPIRRHYYDSGANEGIGFYAEELMLQFGLFDDNPHTREIMYSFMKLRAVRVEVDVKLALGEFTIDEASTHLQEVADLDEATARQEATFFASSPGQAITYQIGKLQLTKLLAETKNRKKESFDLRAFHDFVWLNGNVPISLQRWELLELTDEIEVLDSHAELSH